MRSSILCGVIAALLVNATHSLAFTPTPADHTKIADTEQRAPNCKVNQLLVPDPRRFDVDTDSRAVIANAGCDIVCPPGAYIEGEPTCHDDYDDSFNGGCFSEPPVFTDLSCDYAFGDTVKVCGTYGGFGVGEESCRDTDWYQIVLDGPATFKWCGTGEDDTLIGIIDGNAGCPITELYDYNLMGPCETTCIQHTVAAGTWWLFISTTAFGSSAMACGAEYSAFLTGYYCPPASFESANWGRVKSIYR